MLLNPAPFALPYAGNAFTPFDVSALPISDSNWVGADLFPESA
jgi:hypothetical protein